MLFNWISSSACGLWLAATVSAAASDAALSPPFDQVFELLRTNLTGETRESLERAAVQGLLSELSPRVKVIEVSDADSPGEGLPLIAAQQVYRGKVAYVRLGEVRAGAAGALEREFKILAASNVLKGLVLDLRFASGDDYAAAVAVADLFLTQEVPLINWGEGLKRSTEKEEAISLPVAVLINRETSGAAEGLAGMLRQAGVGLLFGGASAGNAGLTREFAFGTGRVLRVVTAPAQLGNGRRIGPEGLEPDVVVAVNLERDRGLLQSVSGHAMTTPVEAPPPMANGGLSGRMRQDEADLVRRWRGEVLSPDSVSRRADPAGPETRDPVLVRALDLMDGLAILRGRVPR